MNATICDRGFMLRHRFLAFGMQWIFSLIIVVSIPNAL